VTSGWKIYKWTSYSFRYDALTGVPSIQRTVAFEKASVLFNLAALHTQIGSKQDRQSSSETADAAVDNFLRAAGTLRYIGEHFTHPPSFDLAPHTLDALTALFLVCRKVNPVAVVCIFLQKCDGCFCYLALYCVTSLCTSFFFTIHWFLSKSFPSST
jgi:hypothetical protein